MSTASSSHHHFVLLFLVCLLCLLSETWSDELQILLNFKTAVQNSDTRVFDSWRSDNPICSFSGITCNSSGSVREIELSNHKLTGVLPLDSLCKLQFLEKLSLGFNFFNGRISDDLNKCARLQYLDLGNNLFTGPFPDISSLSQLQHLYLNGSGFSGAFPWKSLQNMTNLITLSLGDNPIQRTPFPEEILKLTKLKWLYLSNCSIEGTIPPGIGDLTELINLELYQNYLSGEIPSEIGRLQNLWQLELYRNNLKGMFPIGFRNLTKLENFDASRNHLQGDLSELRFLTNLVTLQLYDNEFSGPIPLEFGDFKKLVNLSLYSNKLTGSLSPKLGSWADFDFIDVSENYLTGSIPSEMCKQGTMRGILMLQNNLTGEIPASYENCTTLQRFRVSNNSLSGAFPSGIWGLPQLTIIDIEFNQIEGAITADIEKAKALGDLWLGNNRLSGEIPEEISQATSLVELKLNDNRFSGRIPESIGELKKLGSLYLQNNMLSGSIPKSLGSCDALSDLNMAHNLLSGEIQSSLGSLHNLNCMNLSENQLSGLIPDSLSSLRLSLLDLSHNRLTGRIPESLSIEANSGSFEGNSGLCSDTINSFSRCLPDSGMSKNTLILILCFAIGSMVLLVSLACFSYSRKREKERERSLREDSWDVKSFHVLTFSEDEILDSIKQENLIGKGGSGNVYKVTLASGKELAVKHIWNASSGSWKRSSSTTPMLGKHGGKSNQLQAEVETLSSIRHVNVVKLYCSITSEDSSLLVYDYLPNGSLWDRLHTSRKMELDWETRYEIALGAAKGLEYLHHGCEKPIIHRDVKSNNILLDELLKPRIADFGLAKILQTNSSKDPTQIIPGTHGYIAPEYGYTTKVNEKSDVYSFGVVLMELVSGKRPIEPEYGGNRDIVDWVSRKLKNKDKVFSILDSGIPEIYRDDAIKVLRIALLCTARLPTSRPSMRSVVQMLEHAEPCKLTDIVVSRSDCMHRSQKTETEKLSP